MPHAMLCNAVCNALRFGAVEDLRARFNGLDPNSPFVTQRAGSQYIWYKTSEGEIERRDAGSPWRPIEPLYYY